MADEKAIRAQQFTCTQDASSSSNQFVDNLEPRTGDLVDDSRVHHVESNGNRDHVDETSQNTQVDPDAPLEGHNESCSSDKQIILATTDYAAPKRIYWPSRSYYLSDIGSEDEDEQSQSKSLIDYAWSKRVLQLVCNKSKLMESFSWLSTVGGGYSSLGESDKGFSSRAGALSLGQQLKLAELLGDERLRVMCHLFAALAALQMNNRQFCWAYIKRVILPLIHAMPHRDPMLTNILKHICFRMNTLDRFIMARRQNAIESTRRSGMNGGNAQGTGYR